MSGECDVCGANGCVETRHPDVVELTEEESDWLQWQSSVLPTDATDCDCGHPDLGPAWHTHDCPGLIQIWRDRAHDLHRQLWTLKEDS